MYEKIEGGTIIDIQGLICNLPPEGHVYNIITKQVEYRGIYEKSKNKQEQYWKRIPMPSWYLDTMKKWDEFDKNNKDDEADFYDERLEGYKKQEWDRRLNGFWYMNNGVPLYLTGMHYLYLQWWSIDIGYPKFRMPDLENFYFIEYCIQDPICIGILNVTKRRFGKSFVAGLFVSEYITRTKMTNGGIQSKTGSDAKKFFAKTVVNPFRRLPRFFRPEYDMSLGVNPKSEMRFQKTNVRGKKANDNIDKDELGSVIDFQSAETVAYDGSKLHRYVADECGKCFAIGTKIRMYNGVIKNVEDIKDGELVMGNDSKARVVYGTTFGEEEMFEVVPKKGSPFTVNKSHIIYAIYSKNKYLGASKIYDKKKHVPVTFTVSEYLSFTNSYKNKLQIQRTGWEYQKNEIKIDPYFLGAWLGDGSSKSCEISSEDTEVINYLKSYSSKCKLNYYNYGPKTKSGINIRHSLSMANAQPLIYNNIKYNNKKQLMIFLGKNPKTPLIGFKLFKNGLIKKLPFESNWVWNEMVNLDLKNNKHIPPEYKINSRENRLLLLAGLLDSDGCLVKEKGVPKYFKLTFSNKYHKLIKDTKELIQSVGFSCNERKESCSNATSFTIFGDIHLIPTKIKRKQAVLVVRKYNSLLCGFNIKPIGVDKYFGFAVDKNHLFLLADGTVVHNTTEVNVYDRHEVIRYCLMDDEGHIIGKALYTTTVEKLSTEKNGIQDAFKLLWEESNQDKRQENGTTSSGLYRFFMSAKRTRNFDDFGFPDEDKTLEQILADRDTVKNNPRALSARIRKEPLTIDEAFSTDADGCIFNVMNIGAREAALKENPALKRHVYFYRDIDQVVRWRGITDKEQDFHWVITQFPPKGEENKHKHDLSSRKPSRTDDGAIAIDGYSNSQGGKYGSKASAWIGRRYNLLDPANTGKAIGHLYGRPQIKETLHEQVMLAAEFYGYQAWYEHNSDDYLSYFRDRGRVNYLGSYPFGAMDPNKRDADRHKGFPTTPFSLTKQTDTGIMYFEYHIDSIDFENLLEDAKKFDPNNRTEFDQTVSFLMLLVCLMEPVQKQQMKEPLVKSYTPSFN